MARRTSPLDGLSAEEQALARVLFGGRAYFDRLHRLDYSFIEQAIRLAKPERLTSTRAWLRILELVERQIQARQLELLAIGFRSGSAALPGKVRAAMAEQIGALAARHSGPRAIALAKELDSHTRQGLRALISEAAKEYAKNPESAVLRRLAREIRPQIGVTKKQARRIQRWARIAKKAGMADRAIAAEVRRRSERAIAYRAKMIAERGVVEAVNYARHSLWQEAMDAGLIPETAMKQWQDQNDGRVRPLHRAQTKQGPIPLEEPYPIQQVMHPPSRDVNCRCFEILILEEGEAA